MGRSTSEIPECQPGLVNIPVPVDLIAAGDCHSMASNSHNGQVYFWGSFRSEVQGNYF